MKKDSKTSSGISMKEIHKMNEENVVDYCRDLAEDGSYTDLFNIFRGRPEVLNYFTIGELSRYYHAGFFKTIPTGRVRGLKIDIRKAIFGDDVI